jgi:bifunctional oligoribonuclease and PAP phosphatase NrnA
LIALDKSLVRRAKELLEDKHQQIVITTHTNPDGDAIGSCLGLYGCLLSAGYSNVHVIVPNTYPAFLQWMPYNNTVINAVSSFQTAKGLIEKASLIFCLDFNGFGRTDRIKKPLSNSQATKILIDHHPQPEKGFDVYFSQIEASSTAELVFEFIINLGWKDNIGVDVAECLYSGIVTDTGSFSFGCNNPRTYEIMAEIMRLGVDGEKIHRLIYSTYSEDRLRLLGYCLSEKLVVLPEQHAAYISLSKDEMKQFNHKVGDTEGIVNYALSIDNINVAALFTENTDHIKISLRSSGNHDVNEFARNHYHGGGHKNASGGKSYDSMEQSLSRFEALIKEFTP